MPRSLLRLVFVVVVTVCGSFPTIARAGDAPIFVVGNWGIGTIDNHFMLYLGHGRYLDLSIPSTPKWVAGYGLFSVVAIIGAWAHSYSRRRRHRRSLDIRSLLNHF